MIALFLKEAGELRGLFVLALVQVLLVGLSHLVLPLSLYDYTSILGFLTADITLIGCLASFAAGHSRFGPEVQTGTLAFLDALPTSRHRVYLVKVITGWLPTGITVTGFFLLKGLALWCWPATNASSGILLALSVAVLSGALMTLHYALGLVLTWFGEVGWQALLISLFTLVMVTLTIPASIDWYPLFSGSFDIQIIGGLPFFNPWPLAGWCILAGGATALSYVLFLGPGERIASGGGWARFSLQLVVYTPPVLGILLLVLLSLLTSAIQLPSLIQPTFRASTEHFRFLATESHREAGASLVAEAEALRTRLAERFDTPGPRTIDIELTGASAHLGGVFIPGKIQLRHDADLQTLAHELSHAWSNHLGEVNHPNAWRFFEEGLATHNEGLVGPPASQAAVPDRSSAAADWFLAPDHRLRSFRFDPDADYAVGRVWVEAIIAIGGYKAVQCVIRTASETPQLGWDALPWWHDVLARCDVSFEELVSAYTRRLPDRRTTEHYGWTSDAGFFHYEVSTTLGLAGERALCFVRSGPGANRNEYAIARADAGEPCRVSKLEVAGGRLQVAVGYEDADGLHFSEWRALSTR